MIARVRGPMASGSLSGMAVKEFWTLGILPQKKNPGGWKKEIQKWNLYQEWRITGSLGGRFRR
jgi:hypothetical protein